MDFLTHFCFYEEDILENLLICSTGMFITISNGQLLLTALSFHLGSCPFHIFSPFLLHGLLVGLLPTGSSLINAQRPLDTYTVILHHAGGPGPIATHLADPHTKLVFFTRTSYWRFVVILRSARTLTSFFFSVFLTAEVPASEQVFVISHGAPLHTTQPSFSPFLLFRSQHSWYDSGSSPSRSRFLTSTRSTRFSIQGA